ncbi:MAG: hypothetical protein S4CHLAM7_06430 [Chlamydiae bacterium]|nr:hypothetical protein [Chlamydiota bacterium]
MPLLPLSIDNQVDHIRQFSKDLLNEKQQPRESSGSHYYATPYYRPYYSSCGESWLTRSLFPHQVHHYQHINSNRNKSKNDNRHIIGVILSIATIGMAFIIGKEISVHSNATNDLQVLQDERKIFHKLSAKKNLDINTFEDINHLFDLQKEILEIYSLNSKDYLFVKGVTFLGLGCAAAGAFMSASQLFGSGIMLASGAALLWAFKAGLDSSDQTIQRKAMQILREANSLGV